MAIRALIKAYLIVCFPLFLVGEQLKIEVKGRAAILMNADTGVVLFQKNADDVFYPASTTKVATALYALKKKREELETLVVADEESLVIINPEVKRKANYTHPAYWQESDGTHIGIKKGEELLFRDLLTGLLVASGNDAANVIARFVSGSVPRFMSELNEFLKEIGCRQTNFCNPHGLHHPDHQTTAYDLAHLTQAALQDPIFCRIVAQTKFIRPKTNKQKAMTFLQGNRLMRAGKFYYPKAIGVKTGYHAKAKHAFIGAARSEGRALIVVLLGCPQRSQMFEEAIKLFDAAFNQPKVRRTYLKAGPQPFSRSLNRANQSINTYLSEDLSLDYYPAEDPMAKCLLVWDNLSLPIDKDQKVGELHLANSEGQPLKRVSLFAAEAVSFKWPYKWTAAFSAFVRFHPIFMGLVVVGFLLAIGAWLLRRGDHS